MSNESPPRKSSSRVSSHSSRSSSPDAGLNPAKRKINYGVPRHRQISVHNPSLSGGGTAEDSSVMPLKEFLYEKGFLEGTCSDVTIRAFDKEYHLHRLILCRSPYFSSMLSGLWSDTKYETATASTSTDNSPPSVFEMHFEDCELITPTAFELAVARLYGHQDNEDESKNLKSMFAVANYLDMPDLEDSCANMLIKSLNQETIVDMLKFSCTYDYGKSSVRITEACKSYLCVDGFTLPASLWEELPDKIVGEVLIHNGFYVPSEWDRCQFIVNLYQFCCSQPLPSESRLRVLQSALNHGVYYSSMHYDQLRTLEKLRTRDNKPLIKRVVLRDGLWLQSDLRQRIETSNSADVVLGFVEEEAEVSDQGDVENCNKDHSIGTAGDQDIVLEDDETPYYFIPQGDENEDEKQNKITRHPPFRFAVHFDNLRDLEEGKRIYSDTYWYAGSYWNVYIQKCRYKKGFQLGVYLHRSKSENSNEDSTTFTFNTGVRREWGRALDDYLQIGNDEIGDEDLTVMTMENLSVNNNNSDASMFRPAGATRQNSILSSSHLGQPLQQQQHHGQRLFSFGGNSSTFGGNSAPFGTNSTTFGVNSSSFGATNSASCSLFATQSSPNTSFGMFGDSGKKEPRREKQKNSTEYNSASYLDSRPEVGAYFEIYTPSRRGKTSLTCFSSAPDKFGFSQSWGWKSTSLWSFTEEKVIHGDESGLKFMIVVGIV